MIDAEIPNELNENSNDGTDNRFGLRHNRREDDWVR